jgi:hypothetical protein
MTTINDEPKLAGDPDAQQGDPEADFDINQEYPEPEAVNIDPTDVVAMAEAIKAGVPIGAAAEAHEASLSTHTWTPGAACPMRSVNRKVHSLTSIYDLNHDENTIVLPPNVTGVNWLARCETHEADFYSKTFAPAWKMRNRPWEFCPECTTIFTQRYGKGALNRKAIKKGKKLKTVTVAVTKPQTPTVRPKDIKAEAASAQATADAWLDAQLAAQDAALTTVVSDERFETTEDLKAAGIPGTVTQVSDAEEACWNKWSASLAKQTPAGGVIDWVGDYHYRVWLADGRAIDLRVHNDEATFKHTDKRGRDHYTSDLPAMLAEIG